MPAHGPGVGGTFAVLKLLRGLNAKFTHTWKYLLRSVKQTALKEAGAHTGCRLQPSGIPHTSLHPSIHPSRGEREKKVEVAGRKRRRRRRKKATNSCLLFRSHVKSCLTHRCHPLVRFHSHVGIKEGRREGGWGGGGEGGLPGPVLVCFPFTESVTLLLCHSG